MAMKKITLVKKNVTRGPRTDSQLRNDGWSNLVTMLGTSSDKRSYSQIQWEYRTPDFFEQMYAGGGIPARIVDLIPEESMRHWVEWTGVDKKTSDKINDVCEALDLRGALLKSWKWGRAYGGGLCHIVTTTNDPASPLQEGEKVIGLRDLSRWDIRILTTDIEYDFGSPNWGYPRIYYLNVQMGSQFKGYPIHWTRMLRFDGQLVPRRTYIKNGYWHDSILNRLFNSIRNYETANDSASTCLMDFSVDVFKMKNLANMISEGHEDIVQARLETMQMAKSVVNSILIDADEEDYENKGRSLQGVAELLVHQANRLVAETDIPHTKLLGESPDGSNATGNSTSQQWYNFIATEQENYLRPKLKRLTQILFPEMKELGFKFKSLRVLDEVEKADVRLKTAQTDQIYLTEQVLDPSEVANSRFGGEEFSYEIELDKEGRESGEIVPGSMNEEEPDEGDDDGGDDGDDTPSESSKASKGSKSSSKEPKAAKKSKADADSVEGQGIGELFSGAGKSGTQFNQHDEVVTGGDKPAEQTFISQTMSEPMRDPRTDPRLPGPGTPKQPRTILPTRGNGITAPSGFDFEKDAGQEGVSREGAETMDSPIINKRLEKLYQRRPDLKKNDEDVAKSKDIARPRAATIIVRRGDKFLMGKTRENGRYTLPGGVVEDIESMHQGAVRELAEETGLQAKKLKFLGSRLVESEMGKPVEVAIYEHSADEAAKPSGKNDPDKEVAKWEWHSTKQLDSEVLANLKHPNNVALDHMGLLK